MIGEELLPHLIEVEQPGTVADRYGNQIPDWAASTRVEVRAWMQQNTGSEDTDQREAQIGEWLLICNPYATDGADLAVHGRDRVHWNGAVFEVIGPPGPAWEPSELHHYEIRLKTVEG